MTLQSYCFIPYAARQSPFFIFHDSICTVGERNTQATLVLSALARYWTVNDKHIVIFSVFSHVTLPGTGLKNTVLCGIVRP